MKSLRFVNLSIPAMQYSFDAQYKWDIQTLRIHPSDKSDNISNPISGTVCKKILALMLKAQLDGLDIPYGTHTDVYAIAAKNHPKLKALKIVELQTLALNRTMHNLPAFLAATQRHFVDRLSTDFTHLETLVVDFMPHEFDHPETRTRQERQRTVDWVGQLKICFLLLIIRYTDNVFRIGRYITSKCSAVP